MIFGTRPEIIKLSPVFSALTAKPSIDVACLFTGQQADLGDTFLEEFEIPVKYHLDVMRNGQNLSQLLSRLLTALDSVLNKNSPDGIVVQGDTTSALAAAMVAHLNHIPVWHVEAGLRTYDPDRPFPEETNRVLIGHLANYHFAATEQNRSNLLNEGIAANRIAVTGNPIVDIVSATVERNKGSAVCDELCKNFPVSKLIVLTAHRRENFASLMAEYFEVLRDFLDRNVDYSLIAPVHPNPSAAALLKQHFSEHTRVRLIEPLGYRDFLSLLERAVLIISDSGGIQEEAATIGRPLIVLRESTERPEAIDCGSAELAANGVALMSALENFNTKFSEVKNAKNITNPFGDGIAGHKIANLIAQLLSQSAPPLK